MVGYRLSSIQIKCSKVCSETDKAAACVTGGIVKAILYRQRKGQGSVFTAIKQGPDSFNCLALSVLNGSGVHLHLKSISVKIISSKSLVVAVTVRIVQLKCA